MWSTGEEIRRTGNNRYGCGLEAWMHWSCIDVIVLGFKSVEELYRSPPLGVDSADNSQLPREKNLYGQFHPILPNNPARQ